MTIDISKVTDEQVECFLSKVRKIMAKHEFAQGKLSEAEIEDILSVFHVNDVKLWVAQDGNPEEFASMALM